MKSFAWILFFAVAISYPSTASAQSIWTGTAGDGNWATDGNWSPSGAPTGDAEINSGANITLPDSATSFGSLTLTVGTINLTASTSTFSTTFLTVDHGGTLNLSIPTGGVVSASNTTFSSFVGDGNGTGVLNLSGNGTLAYTSTALGSAVGLGGNGTFNQSGNSIVDVSGFLAIGADGNASTPSSIPPGLTTATGGTGTYNLSGSATLEVDELGIGVGSGTGGGATTGGTTPTVGLLNITGGTLLVGDLAIGINSTDPNSAAGSSPGTVTGTVNQTGGSATIDDLEVGVSPGATANYQLQGGTLTINNELDIASTAGGIGTFTQSGGTLFANGSINISDGAGTGAFNYNGGTLNLSSGIFIGAGGAFNQNTSITLTNSATQGIFVDTGGAYNLNAGTLTTGGNAIFSGSGNFNFAGGTVAVTGSIWSDFLNGTITSNSTIDTTNFSAILSGNLTGNGNLNIIGGNVVVLTGTNNDSDSWGATIKGGSVLIASSTASLSATGTYKIGTGSTLIVDSSGATSDTFAGTISDTSDLAGTANFETGTNKLVLTGVTNLSTASVTTIGNGGSLEVDNGTVSNVDGSAGNVADTFDVGNGITTGTVRLLGSSTLPNVTVNTGSTLLADTIVGDVTNNGTLASLGTLNVPATILISGSLTSPGQLLIHSNGLAFDTFGSAGSPLASANVTGMVQVIGVGNVTDVPILYSNTAIAAVPPVTAPTALFVPTLTLSGDGKELLLTTVQNPLTSFAQTPNQNAVAGVLDPIINTGTPFPAAFVPILTSLNQLAANQIPGALEELTPESLQYARDIAFENSTFMVQRMNGVDANIRNGVGGLDTNAISVTMPGFDSGLGRSLGNLIAYNNSPTSAAWPPNAAYDPSSSSASSSVSHTSSRTVSDSPNSEATYQDGSKWASPTMTEFLGGDVVLADLNQNHSSANSPSSKANYTAADATAGVGFRIASNLTAGVLFDYNHTDAKTDSHGSKTTVDSYSPGLFATYCDKGFYANGLFSFGYNTYDNTRNIGLLGGAANSNPNGQQYVTDIDVGYDFHPNKNWVVGPTLGLTYTHLDIESFTETGTTGANLAVQSQSVDSLRSRLGGHMVYQTVTNNVLLQPNLTIMWQHEYLDSGSGITSSFSDFGSSPFTIQAAKPARDSALIGCGLSATMGNSLTLYLNYLADIGASDYFAQNIVGGFKARF